MAYFVGSCDTNMHHYFHFSMFHRLSTTHSVAYRVQHVSNVIGFITLVVFQQMDNGVPSCTRLTRAIPDNKPTSVCVIIIRMITIDINNNKYCYCKFFIQLWQVGCYCAYACLFVCYDQFYVIMGIVGVWF